MTTLLAAGGLMPAYQAIPYQPPPRRPAAAGIGRLPRPVTGRAAVPPAAMTALMVRVTPAGRAWVPPARPAASPPDVDVSAIDLSRWTVLDLLLLPLAAWLAAGWEPGRHRHPGQPGRRRYTPRHAKTKTKTNGEQTR